MRVLTRGRNPANVAPILGAIRRMRLMRAGLPERALQDLICQALAAAGLPHERERVFGQGCRADIWVNGVVIEVKRQRPLTTTVLGQIERYARNNCVRAIVLVLERQISLPAKVGGTPVFVISLNSLLGVAVR